MKAQQIRMQKRREEYKTLLRKKIANKSLNGHQERVL